MYKYHKLFLLIIIIIIPFSDVKTLHSNSLFTMAHTLLMVLYRRDCRRSYTPDNHWLIKEVRVSTFINDLDKGKKNVQVNKILI